MDNYLKNLDRSKIQLFQKSGFKDAVAMIFKLTEDSYLYKPLQGKFLNQEVRMTIIKIIYCHIFSKSYVTLSTIKKICVDHNLCSPNTFVSIVNMLIASERVTCVRNSEDRRFIELKLTDKGLSDLQGKMEVQIKCYQAIFSVTDTKLSPKIVDYRLYFERNIQLISHGIIPLTLCPELLYLSKKDSGFTFILYLYLHKDSDAFIKINISELSKRFKVSRVHLCRLVRCAEEKKHLVRVGADVYVLSSVLIKELHSYLSLMLLNDIYCLGYI